MRLIYDEVEIRKKGFSKQYKTNIVHIFYLFGIWSNNEGKYPFSDVPFYPQFWRTPWSTPRNPRTTITNTLLTAFERIWNSIIYILLENNMLETLNVNFRTACFLTIGNITAIKIIHARLHFQCRSSLVSTSFQISSFIFLPFSAIWKIN